MDRNQATSVEPIKKVNLKQQLLDFFIEQIETGAFPVGNRIPDEITLEPSSASAATFSGKA